MNWIKKIFQPRSPLEMAAVELVEAQRAKLAAESAAEFAEAIVDYNTQRILRLTVYLQGEVK